MVNGTNFFLNHNGTSTLSPNRTILYSVADMKNILWSEMIFSPLLSFVLFPFFQINQIYILLISVPMVSLLYIYPHSIISSHFLFLIIFFQCYCPQFFKKTCCLPFLKIFAYTVCTIPVPSDRLHSNR